MNKMLLLLTNIRMKQDNLRVFMRTAPTLAGRNAAEERYLGIENSIYILIIETEIMLNEQQAK